jgi:intein-encoded DNA endonuclease-like protein
MEKIIFIRIPELRKSIFRSFKMVDNLAKYYVVPCKTFTVKFPNIPRDLERHYIRGLFDADGCISKQLRKKKEKSGKVYTYAGGEFSIEGNKELVLEIQNRLVELNLPYTSINFSKKSINRVRYGGID